jgi:uncharacterized protein YcnI
MKKILVLGLGALAALLALTPLASGHAVVSLLQPQGKALTSASVLYVLRVPNERAKQDTIQVSMLVPPDVQGSISVKQSGDWVTVLKRRDTGQKNADGDPVLATEKVTWIAKADSRIKPGFFGEFYFRFRNPASPERLCFSIDQWYTKKEGATKPELVSWSGPSTAATPASCVDVVAT